VSRRETVRVPASVREFCAGDHASPDDYAPGDFILTHNSGFQARLIRFGQALRFWGDDRKYTRWSHTAMIVAPDGAIIEALGNGVVENNIEKYKSTEYHLIKIDCIVDTPPIVSRSLLSHAGVSKSRTAG